jgi:glycosyltransferase involved in cell wall biosynthesis/chaperonin cofactor prefoldin
LKYKISIIVPVFNVEDYIRDALESIIRQTIGFLNLEIIMVNDNSTDKSGDIMDEFADRYENITAIHLPDNSKFAGKPRNIGMDRATSDYLMFLDPDDYYAADACELLYNKITKEDVDIVLGTFTLTDEKTGKRRLAHEFAKKDGNNEIIAKTINDYKTLLCSSPSVWAKIFKRNLIEQNKIRFPEYLPAQDFVFITNALLKARGIIFINQVIVHYNNDRDGSETNRWDKSMLEGRMHSYILTYNICQENGREEHFISLFLKNKLLYWINKFIEADIDNSQKKELLKLSWPLCNICQEQELLLEDLKPIIESIANQKFDDAIILMNQLNHLRKNESKMLVKLNQERENLENQLKKTQKQLKSSNESLKELKNSLNKISIQYDDLMARYYEMQYLNNDGRPLKQRLISLFPGLYILLKFNKNGIKHNLINIKGYNSIKENHLLDIGYYLKNNRDIRVAGKDPIIHYIYYGYKEGLKPNPTFDGENYYKIHPDVRNSKLNPLVHYSLYGIKEERKV